MKLQFCFQNLEQRQQPTAFVSFSYKTLHPFQHLRKISCCLMIVGLFSSILLLAANIGLVFCVPSNEIIALQAMYDNMNGDNWHWFDDYETFGVPWNFTQGVMSDPCDNYWQGIQCTCDSNFTAPHPYSIKPPFDDTYYYFYENYFTDFTSNCSIKSVNLMGYGLTGEFPLEISNLIHLQELHLGWNGISGTFPHVLLSLSELKIIMLNINQLSGTIPDNIGNSLRNLEALSIAANFLEGSIPSSMCNMTELYAFIMPFNFFQGAWPECGSYSWVNMSTLSISSNYFTGTLPNLSHMRHLKILDTSLNQFHGTMPDYTGVSSAMTVFIVNSNRLTGTIPLSYAQKFPLLERFLAFNNMLTGPNRISEMTDLPQLQILQLYNNHLTGSIPPAINKLKNTLRDFQFVGNDLSGTAPEEIYECTLLTYLSYGGSHVVGTLSSSIGNLPNLYHFSVQNSAVTGTIPLSIATLPRLRELLIRYNLLTGTVPREIANLPVLTRLDLQFNFLSGTLPPELFTLPRLDQFVARNNMFTGPLTISNATAFVDSALKFIDFSGNKLSGVVPSEFFTHSEVLESFAVANNCFFEFDLEALCEAPLLSVAVFDGLSAACSEVLFLESTLSRADLGSLPSCVFGMPHLDVLHLSGTGLTGTLPSEDALSASGITSAMTDLSLSHNLLSGTVPAYMQSREWHSLDLSYNKLFGYLQDNFTLSSQNSYIALQANRLSGEIPSSFRDLQSVAVVRGNLFECDYEKNSIPDQDPGKDNYSCGSNTLNLMIYIWGGLFLLLCLYYFNECQHAVQAAWMLTMRSATVHKYASTRNLNTFYYLLTEVRVMFLYVVAFILVVLMPAYIVLSLRYKIYDSSYAWAVSAGFLSGSVACITLLVMWIVFLVWMKYQCDVMFERNCNASAGNIDSKGDSDKNNESTKSMLMREPSTISNTDSITSVVSSSYKAYLYSAMLYGLALSCNVAVVVSANLAYVYVTINYSSTINALAQIALAVFKLLWSALCMPRIIKQVRRTVHGDNANKDSVLLETSINIFDNIVVPCIATAVLEVNCFYNVVVAASAVKATYIYISCNNTWLGNLECIDLVRNVFETVYDPSYSYSYQCSATLLTSYTPVFVSMYVIDAFISPVLSYVFGLWVQRKNKRRTERLQLTKKNSTKSIASNDGSVKMDCADGSSSSKNESRHQVTSVNSTTLSLDLEQPRIEKQTSVKSEILSRVSSAVQQIRFNRLRFLIKLLTDISILVTFGVLFPPLSVIILYTVWSDTSELQTNINNAYILVNGLALADTSSKKQQVTFATRQLTKQLDRQFRGVVDTLRWLLWGMFPLASSFYAFFLFDMLGDEVGHVQAVWPALTMMGVIALWLLLWSVVKTPVFRIVQQFQNYYNNSDNASKGQELKTIVAEDGSTKPNSVTHDSENKTDDPLREEKHDIAQGDCDEESDVENEGDWADEGEGEDDVELHKVKNKRRERVNDTIEDVFMDFLRALY